MLRYSLVRTYGASAPFLLAHILSLWLSNALGFRGVALAQAYAVDEERLRLPRVSPYTSLSLLAIPIRGRVWLAAPRAEALDFLDPLPLLLKILFTGTGNYVYPATLWDMQEFSARIFKEDRFTEEQKAALVVIDALQFRIYHWNVFIPDMANSQVSLYLFPWDDELIIDLNVTVSHICDEAKDYFRMLI